MLEVVGLTCGYGEVIAVRELSFAIEAGEVLALIGANGAGTATTLMCLAGLGPGRAGTVTFAGDDLVRVPARRRVEIGLSLVPEGRRVFADLSVDENLTVGGNCLSRPDLEVARERVYEIFPRLAERRSQRAGSLSGGEQQMLAIGRALMPQPKLIMVDELSLGLSPRAVDECYRALEGLRADGLTMLLVEQNTELAFAVADRICVLEAGRKAWEGTSAEAREDTAVIDAYLGT